MTITSMIVLFAVIWFMALLMALPMRMKSQEQAGERVEGTPSSAPVDPKLGKKMLWVTVVTFLVWAPICWVIASGMISVEDIDIWARWEKG